MKEPRAGLINSKCFRIDYYINKKDIATIAIYGKFKTKQVNIKKITELVDEIEKLKQ